MNNHTLLTRPKATATARPHAGEATVSFTCVFQPRSIEMLRCGIGKSTAISLLVESLAREDRINRQHAENIIRELLERERHCSSAIGRGLAFPHLRTTDVTHFAGAIGIAPDGIAFGSLDGEPTRLLFLTLSPFDDRELHTSLLSRLVGLMQDKAVHLQLMHRLQPQEILDRLADLDLQST